MARVLDRIAGQRPLPRMIRVDHGPEFTSRAFIAWAQGHRIRHILIEPGRPMQNGYIESFNGKFRDECLNEHWFTNVLHARTVIETWRREYNEERPKKALGGLTPTAYAEQLKKSATLTPDS